MINIKGMPRYVQVRETLSDKIKSGELLPGEKLPSEEQLATEFGVSRMTIRKSLDDLVDAGLVYRRHGIGTFVSQSTFHRDHTRLTDFFATCRRQGRIPNSCVLNKEIVPADDQFASALNVEVDEQLIRLTTLRSVDSIPITYHDAYLPVKHFPRIVGADTKSLGLENQHVWQMIEKMGFTMANIVERIEARVAAVAIADLLKVDVGSPILYGERVLYSDEGMPLKYAECYNRGDEYALTVVLVK